MLPSSTGGGWCHVLDVWDSQLVSAVYGGDSRPECQDVDKPIAVRVCMIPSSILRVTLTSEAAEIQLIVVGLLV